MVAGLFGLVVVGIVAAHEAFDQVAGGDVDGFGLFDRRFPVRLRNVEGDGVDISVG